MNLEIDAQCRCPGASPRALEWLESELQRSTGEATSFDPWHALVEHRPLGSIMRARNAAYRVSTAARKATSELDVRPRDARSHCVRTTPGRAQYREQACAHERAATQKGSGMTIATHRWFSLLVSLGLATACSPSPAAVGDSGGADVMASPDVVVVSDAAAVSDAAGSVPVADAAADGGPSTGPRCGLAGVSCGAGQVCCAAGGPDSPERCVAADACTRVRCDATEHCPAGSYCCTDGIQSTCSRTERCGDRACRTAADCPEGQMCTPFGQTRVCR